MENKPDWNEIPEKTFELFQSRLNLVEALTDEEVPESEKKRLREEFQEHFGVTDRTVRNYLTWYRSCGADRLLFYSKKERSPRIREAALREKILEMIQQRPGRTVPTLRKLLQEDPAYGKMISSVSDRTLYRFLMEQGFSQKVRSVLCSSTDGAGYRQFEAPHSLALVQGDARDGIWLPSGIGKGKNKTYLFAWVDDYSRKILCAQYYWDEKLPRMEDTFRQMILRYGIPQRVYLDNGSVYIASQFAWVLKELGIRKLHHKPYQAWSKGKVEAVMKTIKNEFQSEAQDAGFLTLGELNTALYAWIDVVYNTRNHSSTGEAPAERFLTGLPKDHRRITDLAWFDALFLLRETRTVTKYGRIKLCGNEYQVTGVRHGSVIEVRYDPFNLDKVYRFENGVSLETLIPFSLKNTSSPAVPEERPGSDLQVSKEAACYFENLREKQKDMRKSETTSIFSRLTEGLS